MSLIEDAATAEWATRKISIIGVAKSFISQLSVGQDLTKVSLPAVFLYPYSALEMISARYLQRFHLLLSCRVQSDPVERMLCVVKWFVTAMQKEKLDKKPYNPLLGETHVCWNGTAEHGTTKLVSEQVSHHPPVSAISIMNDKEGVSLLCNLSFSIKFHGNSVSVKSDDSPIVITLNNHSSTPEQYHTHLPNVGIRNVIIGTKRIAWEGVTVIRCEQTGLQCSLTLKEEGWYCVNTINGVVSTISNPNTPIKVISGNLGEVINITDPSTGQTQVFVDAVNEPKVKTQYPPLNEQDERNSLRIWSEVSKAIVDDDMETADIEKIKLENGQRKRRQEGKNWEVRHFSLSPTTKLWEPVQNVFQQAGTSWGGSASSSPVIDSLVDGEIKIVATANNNSSIVGQ